MNKKDHPGPESSTDAQEAARKLRETATAINQDQMLKWVIAGAIRKEPKPVLN